MLIIKYHQFLGTKSKTLYRGFAPGPQWGRLVSDIAVFVLKRDVKLQPNNHLPDPVCGVQEFLKLCCTCRVAAYLLRESYSVCTGSIVYTDEENYLLTAQQKHRREIRFKSALQISAAAGHRLLLCFQPSTLIRRISSRRGLHVV